VLGWVGVTTPTVRAGASAPAPATLDHYGWRQYCHGLFQIPELLYYQFATHRVSFRPAST